MDVTPGSNFTKSSCQIVVAHVKRPHSTRGNIGQIPVVCSLSEHLPSELTVRCFWECLPVALLVGHSCMGKLHCAAGTETLEKLLAAVLLHEHHI